MIFTLESHAEEFCSSSYFLPLDPSVKEHGLGLLFEFLRCLKSSGCSSPERISESSLEAVLFNQMAGLALPVEAKQGIPSLLAAFFTYLSETGHYPPAKSWIFWMESLQSRYAKRIRPDGTVKGETYKKKYTDVDRNDPCPCGSGKKFKKCCLALIG